MPADSKPLSTTSRLSTLMTAQRKAIDELTQINQLRQTLKNSVINQVEANLQNTLAGSQLRDLINHRGTQAELNHIIGRLTLKPHQDITHLTDAVAKELVAASDHRLQLLVRLASKNPRDDFQKQLNKSLENDPQSRLSLKLIESRQVDGKDSSQILESLKAASMNDSSGKPRLAAKLKSILPNVDDDTIAALESSLATQTLTTIIDDSNVSEVVDRALKQHSITLDPNTQTEMAREIGAALKLESANIDSSDYLSEFRTQMITDDTDAETMSAKLSDGGYSIDDVYYADNNKQSFPQINPDSVRLVERIIKNPELLNDSAIYKEFLGGSRLSPHELVQQWRTFFNPTTAGGGSSSGLVSTLQSWGQGLSSKFQIGTKGFFEGARSLLKPLGKIISNLGSSLGPTLRSFASTISSTLGKVLPAIGKGLLAFGRAAVAVMGKALVAVVASAEVWLPIVLIGLVIVILFLTIFSPSPFTVARTNLAPVAAGGGEGGDYNALICTPDEPDCPASFCQNCAGPVKCGSVTQCPGGSFTHKTLNAIDFGMNGCSGSDMGVYSPVGGTVTTVFMKYRDGSGSPNSSEGYGNNIRITFKDSKTGREFELIFGHLSNQNNNGLTNKITVGQTITAGQLIGYADHTGVSTAPHLHFELKAVDGGKVPSITTLVPNSGCK